MEANHSSGTEDSEEDLSEKKRLLGVALDKIQEVENVLTWYRPPSLSSLKQEITSVKEYYSFLMTTQTTIFCADLGYFSVLPMEVLFQVFSFLDAKGLTRISCVCKQFKVLAEEESHWQRVAIQILSPQHIEYKPAKRTWKWLCRAALKLFKESDTKDEPGTFLWSSSNGVSQSEDQRTDTRYSGDWKANKRHGYGTYFWSNGSLYTGEWVDDKREGHGTRVWPNKNRYTGEYQNHKRHGMGEFTFSNGSVFTGSFEDNKFIKGTYTWPNGRIYNGEWNNIFRHGKGSYSWPDGRTYTGDWAQDKRHGNGVYTWPDGDSYEGKFIDGKRVGSGVLKCANGDIYDQEWNEDKFEEFNKGLEEVVDGVTVAKPVFCRKRKRPEEDPENLTNLKIKRRRA
jgi:hypothetical protein